jgi:alcohol dehydrogenase
MAGKLKPSQLITHHFDFEEILKTYEVFGNAVQQHALKIILRSQI